MIRCYYLPVDTMDGTEVVAGIEYIHNALLEATIDPDERLLIMDVTIEENAWLSNVAVEDFDAGQEEIDRYLAQVITRVPDPDVERIKEILENSPPPIPAPQVWELFKLLAKLHSITV